jgi:hypothetical protein
MIRNSSRIFDSGLFDLDCEERVLMFGGLCCLAISFSVLVAA